MGSSRPKQYLPLLGVPLMFHAMATLAAHPAIHEVFVVLSPQDREFDRFDWSAAGAKCRALRCGGRHRAQTVLNGLHAIRDRVAPRDWILVHDAVRPCLPPAVLDRMIAQIGEDEVGGLLAMPVADTLKRGNEGRVDMTESRDGMWQAQTPQMFRYDALLRALGAVALDEVTDESSAIERLGLHPLLVMSTAANLKVTYGEDLDLAEHILRSRAGQE